MKVKKRARAINGIGQDGSKRVIIVILNYLNYIDTEECVNSIVNMNYDVKGVVIVDNHSNNESIHKLTRKYKDNEDIHIIRNKKNLGFAKGNNVGIHYAREYLSASHVLVVNNDTVFIDPGYIDKLLEEDKQGVGVIGSAIQLGNNKVQALCKMYTGVKDVIISYMGFICLKFNAKMLYEVIGSLHNNKNMTNMLHGSAIMFTDEYFYYYNGFYPHTFLFHEEELLYLQMMRFNLKQVYVKDAVIYHKEDQSSMMSFENKDEVKLKYSIKSYKHVIFMTLFKHLYS